MKKLFCIALFAALVSPVLAAETAPVEQPKYAEGLDNVWPSPFAVSDWPASPELIGLRITIPYSSAQETVTGIDLGLWGRCRDAEGLQISVLRNDVKDTLAGFQIGLYNSAVRADLFCIQIGLFNETQSFRGFQAGLVNKSGAGQGFQLGLVNACETFHGYQVGLVNVIRDAEVAFLPIVNIGF